MNSLNQVMSVALIASALVACSPGVVPGPTSGSYQDKVSAAQPLSVLATASGEGRGPVPAPTPDSEQAILDKLIAGTKLDIELVKQQIADLEGNPLISGGRGDFVDQLQARLTRLEDYLDSLLNDPAVQRAAIDAYTASEYRMVLAEDYRRRSCAQIDLILARNEFASDFERELALSVKRVCDQQAIIAQQEEWRSRYATLTCDGLQAKVDAGSFSSSLEEGVVRNLLQTCRYQEAYTKYSSRSCQELKIAQDSGGLTESWDINAVTILIREKCASL